MCFLSYLQRALTYLGSMGRGMLKTTGVFFRENPQDVERVFWPSTAQFVEHKMKGFCGGYLHFNEVSARSKIVLSISQPTDNTFHKKKVPFDQCQR